MKKHAIITGGANGIGQALIQTLQNDFETTSLDLSSNPNSNSIECTVTNLEELKTKTHNIQSCDLLVLCAGIMRRGTLLESSEADFDALFAVNVKGYWNTLKALESKLSENATIVFISSVHALDKPAKPSIYTITKCADAAMGETLRAEGKWNVKIAYLGPTVTDMNEKSDTKKRDTPQTTAVWIKKLIESQNNTLTYDGEYHLLD